MTNGDNLIPPKLAIVQNFKGLVNMNKGAITCIDFNLKATPRPKRRKIWVDTLKEFFYHHASRLPDDFAIGDIVGRRVGELSIARINADAMSVWRTSSHITRDAIDEYSALLPNSTRIALRQRSKEAIVGGNRFALISTSDANTFMQNDTVSYDNT